MTTDTTARDNLALRIQVLNFMFNETDDHKLDPEQLKLACTYTEKALACITKAILD